MKIIDVRAVQPATPGSPDDWRTQLGQIVVEVRTDEGLCGIGGGGGGAAGIHVVQTVLRDLLIGCDAAPVEELHERMLRHTVFYGRKGLVVMAISGVDLALWDLRGKTAGAPVARLLNAEVDLSRPIETYATVFDDADAHEALAAGHRAIKLHVERFGDRPAAATIAELVERVRSGLSDNQPQDGKGGQAVQGTRADDGTRTPIMIDAFARWDVDTTLRIAEAVAPLDVDWIEEPLPPDDLDGYALLAEQSPVPIAGGEHEFTADGFRQLIDRRLHQVLQPDVNWCGGLTTLVQVYAMARDAGLRVCPHRGCEPFALPALAALDPRPLAESPRKWFTCLHGAPQIRSGVIHPSDQPGFGVSVDASIWKS